MEQVESFNSLHPQVHHCDLSLAMKFRGFPQRAIKGFLNGLKLITLILTFTSVPFMFVLETDLNYSARSQTRDQCRPPASSLSV